MIKLRPAGWSDRDIWAEWYGEPVRHLVFGTQPTVSIEAHSAALRRLLADDSAVLLIALVDNLRIGMVRADRGRDGGAACEIGVYLKPAYCGKGYMAELLASATAFLVQTRRPALLRLTASAEHPGVRRVLQQAGYAVRQPALGGAVFEYVSGTPEVSP